VSVPTQFLASEQLSVEQSPEWRGCLRGAEWHHDLHLLLPITRLHWYRQDPGERPLFLLILHGKGSETQEPNFTVDHDPGQKWSSLHIHSCQLGDTAPTYFCAFNRDTW
uniref:Immunoglobulin V-set domain-containing protein n=1 Tax=Gopherus evgoodei TaxID=1825980 RepID=A0A8C4Y7U1_9SAUR